MLDTNQITLYINALLNVLQEMRLKYTFIQVRTTIPVRYIHMWYNDPYIKHKLLKLHRIILQYGTSIFYDKQIHSVLIFFILYWLHKIR